MVWKLVVFGLYSIEESKIDKNIAKTVLIELRQFGACALVWKLSKMTWLQVYFVFTSRKTPFHIFLRTSYCAWLHIICPRHLIVVRDCINRHITLSCGREPITNLNRPLICCYSIEYCKFSISWIWKMWSWLWFKLFPLLCRELEPTTHVSSGPPFKSTVWWSRGRYYMF